MDWTELEGVAREIVDGCGAGELPVPIRDVARAWGLKLREDSQVRRGRLVGDAVHFNPNDTEAHIRFAVAHELGHWALRRIGQDCGGHEEETLANYLAGAMLLPPAQTKRVLAKHGHDWEPVVALAQVSWEVFTRRYVQLYTAVARMEGTGRRAWRGASPWLAKARPTALELRLRDEAQRTGTHVHTGQQSAAYVVDGERRRLYLAVALDEE